MHFSMKKYKPKFLRHFTICSPPIHQKTWQLTSKCLHLINSFFVKTYHLFWRRFVASIQKLNMLLTVQSPRSISLSYDLFIARKRSIVGSISRRNHTLILSNIKTEIIIFWISRSTAPTQHLWGRYFQQHSKELTAKSTVFVAEVDFSPRRRTNIYLVYIQEFCLVLFSSSERRKVSGLKVPSLKEDLVQCTEPEKYIFQALP